MKKPSKLLLLLAIFFAALTYYFTYYGDGGADGLNSFIPLVITAVLFVCFLISFFFSLFLVSVSSAVRRWVMGIVVAIPILGLIGVIAVFGYFSADYTFNTEDTIAKEKSVLKTVQFKDDEFGVRFQHISGVVNGYNGEQPVVTTITPRIENNVLVVPSDDKTYLEPNVLLKIENETDINIQAYFKVLVTQLVLEDVSLEKVALGNFKNLKSETKIWTLKSSYLERKKITQFFMPKMVDGSDLIYFLQVPKKPKTLMVLIVSGTTYSAAASVEKLSSDNFTKGNMWFHTLEFLN